MEGDLKTRNIDVTLNIPEGECVRADPRKIERVLSNILGNARDAMLNGGTLTITAVSTETDVLLSISDDGCGMSEDVRARLFEPFFTQGKSKGTGLGMAIVRQIVTDHRGDIEVESQEGQGTTVRFSLPRLKKVTTATTARSGGTPTPV